MRALAERGDHAAALGVYDQLRRMLRDDLGSLAEPGHPGPLRPPRLIRVLPTMRAARAHRRSAGGNVPPTFRPPCGNHAAETEPCLILGSGKVTTSGTHEELIVNQVSCECGYSVRDIDEDRVVESTMQHVSSAHPDLVDTVTPDVVRGWIVIGALVLTVSPVVALSEPSPCPRATSERLLEDRRRPDVVSLLQVQPRAGAAPLAQMSKMRRIGFGRLRGSLPDMLADTWRAARASWPDRASAHRPVTTTRGHRATALGAARRRARTRSHRASRNSPMNVNDPTSVQGPWDSTIPKLSIK